MRRQDTAVWRGLRVTSKSRSEAGLLSQDLAGRAEQGVSRVGLGGSRSHKQIAAQPASQMNEGTYK